MGIRQEQLAGGAPPFVPAGQWPPVAAPAPAMLGPVALSWPPSADSLDYLQKFITVALLLIGLPALLTYALKSPSQFSTAAARKHVA